MNILAPERQQFAGHGLYDHAAICLTCGKHHLIAKGEAIGAQPWLDWLEKHPAPGHWTMVVPYAEIKNLVDFGRRLTGNADAKEAFGSSADYTATLTGLASSSTLIAGRETTWLSNASNKYLDELVAGFIGIHESVNITANTYIEVWGIGPINDAPTYPDAFTGTNSAVTITNAGIKSAICLPVAGMLCPAATQNIKFPFAPIGLAQRFGWLPATHGLWVTHSTGQNLGVTGANHKLSHTPVYATLT